MERQELEMRFTAHECNADQVLRQESIRHVAKDLALCVNDLCPEGRLKALALTNIETAMMQANKAIAEE